MITIFSFSDQRPNEFFEAVDLNFVHKPQLLAQLAFGKAFLLIPYQIRLGQLHKQLPLVFAERHTGVGYLHKFVLIGLTRLHKYLIHISLHFIIRTTVFWIIIITIIKNFIVAMII